MLANRGAVFTAPNPLRAKLGGIGALNADAVAKAEAAMKELSANFSQWLGDEVARLEAARAAVHAEDRTPASTEALYFRAHDLKGLGATYDYPLIGRIAGSLCRLLDEPAKRGAAPLSLIDAHVDTIRACLRGQIKDASHPTGGVLAAELEAQVTAHAA